MEEVPIKNRKEPRVDVMNPIKLEEEPKETDFYFVAFIVSEEGGYSTIYPSREEYHGILLTLGKDGKGNLLEEFIKEKGGKYKKPFVQEVEYNSGGIYGGGSSITLAWEKFLEMGKPIRFKRTSNTTHILDPLS